MKINKLTLNERKNDILSYFGEIDAPFRTSEVAEHLGVSAYQARHYLQCLEREGKLNAHRYDGEPVRCGKSAVFRHNPSEQMSLRTKSGSGKHFTTVNDHHPCSDSGCFREKINWLLAI